MLLNHSIPDGRTRRTNILENGSQDSRTRIKLAGPSAADGSPIAVYDEWRLFSLHNSAQFGAMVAGLAAAAVDESSPGWTGLGTLGNERAGTNSLLPQAKCSAKRRTTKRNAVFLSAPLRFRASLRQSGAICLAPEPGVPKLPSPRATLKRAAHVAALSIEQLRCRKQSPV
jgi:hypothetical protein